MVRPWKPGVYSITDTRTGRVYIGSSKDIHTRWLNHQSQFRHGVNRLQKHFGETVTAQAGTWESHTAYEIVDGLRYEILETWTNWRREWGLPVSAEQRWINAYRAVDSNRLINIKNPWPYPLDE